LRDHRYTVTSIANLSHGIVNFHFQSKDQLLLEALQSLVDEHLMHWRSGLKKAPGNPAEQLLVLISTYFAPEIANPQRLAVWFAYWGEVNNRPAYREIADSKDRQRHDQMRLLCAELNRDGAYPENNSEVFTINLE
jgi:TetR/AcrR family transcriptional repressor of bet genes